MSCIFISVQKCPAAGVKLIVWYIDKQNDKNRKSKHLKSNASSLNSIDRSSELGGSAELRFSIYNSRVRVQ
jgi:hypothetical protein